ncbi:glycosyltransferase family 4 protein [Mesobacillus jeotgali]|uniref:glycosyltransferase family 4 protein n=1 Tax=Mesobacillus jeotgali TaxID=129985 RepID=UPI000C864740|nr:glycosyltransferase family 4 protein [Mesobacillus jeotgali]
MKVLVICHLLSVGGVNAGWRNRSIYLKKHGIDTEFLYTTDLGGLHIMEDVARVYLTKDENEIIGIIQSNNYDAIIVIDTKDAYTWIRKSGFAGPVIIEAHTPEIIKLQPHLKSLKTIKPKSIIVPSNYQKRVVSILFESKQVEVIYNGVDLSFFRPLLEREIDYSSEPILATDKKIIGWIGHLDNRKNWQMLLKIAKRIKKERNDIEFWVIGGAQSLQRAEFAAKWQEESLSDIVKWHPVIPYHQMPNVYAKIRKSGGCTLATTKSESFGITYIESMACGIPVVAPNMMPVTELVLQEKTGMLYYGQKVDDAVKKLYSIIDAPGLQQQISRAAIQHVKQHFAIEVVADQYLDLLYEIIYGDQLRGDQS